MGHVINTNDHPAYVRDASGTSVPIAAGAVLSADGEFLDALLATPGIEKASAKDVKASEDAAAPAPSGGKTPDSVINDVLIAARAAATALIAATNQIVIGDDLAPHGPPSGTVTTKQALAKSDPEHFAENEAIVIGKTDHGSDTPADALVAGATPASSADVHNAQVEAQENVGDVAARLAALQAETEAMRASIDAEPDAPAPADEDEAQEPETPDESTRTVESYEGEEWTGKKLDEELAERDLPTSGNKAVKAARLRESDAANDEQL